MPYRNKVYVAFDGDNDMTYYNMLKAWNANDNVDFTFYDAHSINTARDTSLEASIKSQLRIRLQNTKVLILLVGEQTRYLYKFVRWELETALRMDIPIIAVNLNGLRYMDAAGRRFVASAAKNFSVGRIRPRSGDRFGRQNGADGPYGSSRAGRGRGSSSWRRVPGRGRCGR